MQSQTNHSVVDYSKWNSIASSASDEEDAAVSNRVTHPSLASHLITSSRQDDCPRDSGQAHAQLSPAVLEGGVGVANAQNVPYSPRESAKLVCEF